jgi:hypothetical protein
VKRITPKLGDALVVNYHEHPMPRIATVAVIAECECGTKHYSAVSGSSQSARKLIYRKHVKHLDNCPRQRELFALDGKE